MIPLYPQQFPPRKTSTLEEGGSLNRLYYYLLTALFNRTGGTSGIPSQVGAGLIATGASQATALELSDDYNEVLGGGGGVLLTQLQPGQEQEVFNGTGGNLDVYPQVGGLIDALGVNSPYVLANGKTQVFYCPKLLANGVSFYRSFQQG